MARMMRVVLALIYLTVGSYFGCLAAGFHQKDCPKDPPMSMVDGAVIAVLWLPDMVGSGLYLMNHDVGEVCTVK